MLKLTTKRTEWFTCPQDPEGDCKVEILHLKPGVVSDIEAKANQITGKQYGDDFHTEIDFNLNERLKTFVRKSVVNIKGFIDSSGLPMKCTEQNLNLIMTEYDWFGTQVEEFRAELAEKVALELHGEEKN